MASDLLRELAPLLAEEGIDVDNIDVPDVETLQRVLVLAAALQSWARHTETPLIDLARTVVR